MNKAKTVIDYYVLCNKLKDVVRTGWKNWKVKRERVESVAEHIYGTQMLAIAMQSEYGYNVNLKKVIEMLAVHELGEIIIGDLTQFEISKEQKEEIEHKAVKEILRTLATGKEIEELFLEFDEKITPEAQFAYLCDKLECDIQCKLYDEEHCVDLNAQHDNTTAENQLVKKLLNNGDSWSAMWLKFGQIRYPYDEHFAEVSNYALTHNILKNDNN